MIAEKLCCVFRSDALLNWRRVDQMIQPVHKLERQVSLRISLIAFAEERLAMQIADLDHVIVDDRQSAHARACKRRYDRAADPPCADHRDGRGFQLALPHAADLRQHDVPRITFELPVGEGHRPVEPKPPAPRLVSLSTATSTKSAFSTGAGTSCAMRSPRRTSNGSEPRLARITFTSPR